MVHESVQRVVERGRAAFTILRRLTRDSEASAASDGEEDEMDIELAEGGDFSRDERSTERSSAENEEKFVRRLTRD